MQTVRGISQWLAGYKAILNGLTPEQRVAAEQFENCDMAMLDILNTTAQDVKDYGLADTPDNLVAMVADTLAFHWFGLEETRELMAPVIDAMAVADLRLVKANIDLCWYSREGYPHLAEMFKHYNV